MECEDVRTWLPRYVENDVNGPLRDAIRAHLDTCYLCCEEQNEIRAVLDACQGAIRHPAPKYAFDALRAELRAPVVTVKPGRSYRGLLRAAGAAVAAIMLLSLVELTANAARQWELLASFVHSGSVPDQEPDIAALPPLLGWPQRFVWACSLSEGADDEAAPSDAAKSDGSESQPRSPSVSLRTGQMGRTKMAAAPYTVVMGGGEYGAVRGGA